MCCETPYGLIFIGTSSAVNTTIHELSDSANYTHILYASKKIARDPLNREGCVFKFYYHFFGVVSVCLF